MAEQFVNGTTTEAEPTVAATMKETDRKCPQCGGTMDFDPKTGGLKCPYCDYEEAIPAAQGSAVPQNTNGSAAELKLEDAEKIENCDWGLETKTVICKSCGAESVYDAHVVSAECPYCGSNQVMEASDSKTMAPGGVVPFKIDQAGASNRFLAWIKGKFFAPKLAKQSAKAGSFKGVYLPYWTFDASTASSYTAEYGINRTVKEKDGNERTVTDWYPTNGRYAQNFDDELVCGTTRYNTGMLSGIEPYETAENKVYKPEYVAGFAAERYTVGIKAAWEKAKEMIKNKLRSAITNKIMQENRADTVRNLNVQSDFSNMTYKYLLLPVWLSSFQYNGKVYQFMVNGQTGKVSGSAPVSAWKVILTILICLLILWLFFGGGCGAIFG